MADSTDRAPEGRFYRDLADVPADLEAPTGELSDTFGRRLRDLRISVVDRCNFRCVYCMPKEVFGMNFHFLPKEELLTFEEITRVARVAVAHGVEKLRLTGGEPLLRTGLEELIAMLTELRTPEGRPVDIALTTNGSVLARKAEALSAAGLHRITVSLDSLDDEVFRAMNDVDFPVSKVLDGIEAAAAAGMAPIKINMVVKRSLNDTEILPMARYFRKTPYTLRFIEFMDVGSTNGWRLDEVVPSKEIVHRISAEFPLEPADPNYTGEVADRWRYTDGSGEIGVISSVTQPFCATCTRIRISTDGKLFTCLFATEGHDLREIMRTGGTDEQLATVMAQIWRERTDRYSLLRSSQTEGLPHHGKRIEMSYIGG